MGRDLTTVLASQQDAKKTMHRLSDAAWLLSRTFWHDAGKILLAMAIGALLIALVYQFPVAHTVDIGGYDAAYTQGFYDPEHDTTLTPHPELSGSDGSARWTGARSYLLFPQAGLPAQLTIKLRGWRPSGMPPNVTLLLNGSQTLAAFRTSGTWEEHTVALNSGLLKPNDVVIEIRSDTTQLEAGDSRAVGVLVDTAILRVGSAPIIPYPSQLIYGALATGILYVLMRAWQRWLLAVGVLCAAFLLLYRAQPFYPYPLLRLLPLLDAILMVWLLLRYGQRVTHLPLLLDALALVGIAAWFVILLRHAQQHVTLSLPSVEGDFRVFALRSAHLLGQFPAGTTNPDADGVLRADGFYNLGYPLLLFLVRPLVHGNAFLAGRLVAAASGALLLFAGWWLARQLLGRGAALLSVLMLAFSPLVVEYALYLGTDMPFAAVCTLALALLVAFALRHQLATVWIVAMLLAAGAAAGSAFLIRHPGLLLLPCGWLLIESAQRSTSASLKYKLQHPQWLLLFSVAFLLTILPQLLVNMRDTGQLFYSQQAKNVWQAVFGAGDWARWATTSNDVALSRVIAQDPARFLANWWANVRGFIGTGGEDTREFGQATQLRLLAFPANWLALCGMIGGFGLSLRQCYRDRAAGIRTNYAATWLLLGSWLLLYVVAVNVGLAPQSRFFLPLVPVYALAGAWLLVQLGVSMASTSVAASSQIVAGIVLLVLISGSFSIGADYVTRTRLPAGDVMPGQPADEVAAAWLVQQTLLGDQYLVLQPPLNSTDGIALGKYSAIADRVVAAPASDELDALRATGAAYLLRADTLGAPPGDLPALAAAGGYTLYILR